MPGQNERVILDTNVWISLLLSRDFLKFDKLLAADQITLLLSEQLVEEFVTVTQRAKFRRYFDLDLVATFVHKIQDAAEIINVTTEVKLCRDPDDDYLLALAIDGNATHLITGDKDILILGKLNETRILTLTEYLDTNKIF